MGPQGVADTGFNTGGIQWWAEWSVAVVRQAAVKGA